MDQASDLTSSPVTGELAEYHVLAAHFHGSINSWDEEAARFSMPTEEFVWSYDLCALAHSGPCVWRTACLGWVCGRQTSQMGNQLSLQSFGHPIYSTWIRQVLWFEHPEPEQSIREAGMLKRLEVREWARVCGLTSWCCLKPKQEMIQ